MLLRFSKGLVPPASERWDACSNRGLYRLSQELEEGRTPLSHGRLGARGAKRPPPNEEPTTPNARVGKQLMPVPPARREHPRGLGD